MNDTWNHIAFIALVAGCVALEIFGVAGGAGALWVLVVIWAMIRYL